MHTSFVIRPRQIRRTTRYHFTPTSMAAILKNAKQQVLVRMWRHGNSLVHWWWECKTV